MSHKLFSFVFVIAIVLIGAPLLAQANLAFDQSPAYARYQELNAKRGEFSQTNGRASKIKWSADGISVYYTTGGDRNTTQLDTLETTPYDQAVEPMDSLADDSKLETRWGAGRAEQFTEATSPDGKTNAVYRDFDMWLESADGSGKPKQITTDGAERHRYGTACWVYGEELYQSDAIWWSGDGKKLVFYEIIEDGMKDYYLTFDNTASYTRVEAVRYPKAGDPNPQANLMVYDLDSGDLKRLEIPGEERQYLYKIRFAPDGQTLLVNRTNRHQDVMDLLAVNLVSGEVRTVVGEKQATWQNNLPTVRFLADGQRFVWETEANGWKHYQLRHLDGRLLNTLSDPKDYPCENIVLIDEAAGWFYYSANSDANPYNAQLHRVKLDGTGHQRISSSPLNHTSFMIAPGHKYVVAVREAMKTPHQTAVYDCESGKEVTVLATGDASVAEASGIAPAELFSFMADDGKTEIFGWLKKPINFDPSKKYSLVIDVYGGPTSRGLNNDYSPFDPMCALGFLVAKVGNRGTTGRGKAFESATYQTLGGADIADQASAVRYLRQRDYVDGNRVGIYGHSYGGYMSALGILKYPDVFQVAVAGAPVTDWRNYDTIYTERYMRTPQENSQGYTDGSCIPLAGNLQGKLMIVHGLIDDNVHPANTWQLAEALQNANKSFDMMIYPGFKHGIGSNYKMLVLEYLYRNLHNGQSGASIVPE